MLISNLYHLTDTSGATEDQVVSVAVASQSDVMDLQAAGLPEGRDLWLNVICSAKHATLAADVNLTIIAEESDAGATFQTFAQKIVNTSVGDVDADLLAIGGGMRIKLPGTLRKYLRVTITPAASITNTATFKAFITTN